MNIRNKFSKNWHQSSNGIIYHWSLFVGIILLLLSLTINAGLLTVPKVQAAAWTGILADTRAIDWSSAGVTGGIPNRTNICSSLTAGSTASQINTAISNCSNAGGGVVSLGAGTFSVSSSIVMKSNVTLRGQGVSTIISFTNMGGSGYFWGAGEAGIVFQGANPTPNEVAPGLASVPSTKLDWTGTNGAAGVYTQGATVVNLSSTPSGLSAGDTLVLWQSDDTDASVPNNGYFVSSKTGASGAIAWEGSGETQGTGQQQRVRVVSVSGSQVTIARGIELPAGTWRTARAPKAGWFTQAQTIHDAGVESMLVRSTAYTSEHHAVIAINWAADSWLKGVAVQPRTTTWHASNAVDYGIIVTDSRNITIRDGWVDRMIGGGLYTTTSYGIALKTTFDSLVENNILNQVESPLMILTASAGNVFGYNYENYTSDNQQEGGFQQHQVGSSMNLIEGNEFIKEWSDFFHGSTVLSTYFRNYVSGTGFDVSAYHRWYNFVGNVMAATVYKGLATDSTKYDRWSSVGFRLGYPQQNASNATTNGVAYDPVTWTSAMLWGNFINSGGTRFLSAEVPSADPVFPNPVPASQTLPASFYLSAKPSWWPTSKAWPPIGPDVTTGTVANFANHVSTLPARDCFSASSSSITNFNPSACYVASGTPPPPPPPGPTPTPTPTPPPPPVPTVNLTAAPTSITSGSSSTLTWSSTNATSCTASNAWTGTKATSGTQAVSPTVTSTYTLTCTGTGGSGNQSATVTVSTGSGTFINGDRVVTLQDTYVRSTPSTTGNVLQTHVTSEQGIVIGGPTVADGFTWWNINYDVGSDGWSTEQGYLAKATGPVVGDMNSDHIVNSIDFSLFNSKWFTTDATSDFNHDNLVNAIDFSVLNANWLRTW